MGALLVADGRTFWLDGKQALRCGMAGCRHVCISRRRDFDSLVLLVLEHLSCLWVASNEVHFVHYNSDKHTGLTAEALADGEGLAVLGYFIDAGDYPESELDRIIQAAYGLYDYEADAGNISFNPHDMVEGNFENFWRYEGSLTTPTCNEAVMWTVFDKPLTINMKTRDMIVGTAETRAVNNNYRVPMPLNGRTVTYYHDNVSMSSAQTTTASLFFATCAALALN